MELNIAPLSAQTLAACCEVAAQAPDPWNPQAMETAMQDLNRWSFVATQNGAVLGFACFLVVADSADLEQLVVDNAARRRGVGRALLQQALPQLAPVGVQRVLLEVRCGNRAAIALYHSLGFKTLATRRGMYQNPPEDGFLMAKGLTPESDITGETKAE